MFKRLRLFRPGLAVLMMISLASVAFGDTIRLKDGSIIKGTIVSFAKGKFVVIIGSGSRTRELTFMDSEIESIQFDNGTTADVTNRSASYTPPDPPRVITVDNTRVDPPTVRQPQTAAPTQKAKPITWTVKVLADNTANGWTNTGFVVRKGQRIRISGDGKISLGGGRNSTASGMPNLEDENKLLKNVATGALIAVIGDDNNDFIYVGAEREFTATRDGALFLGINEGNLDDNSGSYNAKIEIFPDV